MQHACAYKHTHIHEHKGRNLFSGGRSNLWCCMKMSPLKEAARRLQYCRKLFGDKAEATTAKSHYIVSMTHCVLFFVYMLKVRITKRKLNRCIEVKKIHLWSPSHSVFSWLKRASWRIWKVKLVRSHWPPCWTEACIENALCGHACNHDNSSQVYLKMGAFRCLSTTPSTITSCLVESCKISLVVRTEDTVWGDGCVWDCSAFESESLWAAWKWLNKHAQLGRPDGACLEKETLT